MTTKTKTINFVKARDNVRQPQVHVYDDDNIITNQVLSFISQLVG